MLSFDRGSVVVTGGGGLAFDQAERTSPPLNPGQPVPAVRLRPGGA